METRVLCKFLYDNWWLVEYFNIVEEWEFFYILEEKEFDWTTTKFVVLKRWDTLWQHYFKSYKRLKRYYKKKLIEDLRQLQDKYSSIWLSFNYNLQ